MVRSWEYVSEGSWRYLERDWVAIPGTVISEPPGDVHTLVSGDTGTLTLFVVEGGQFYVDDDDNLVGHEDVLTLTHNYEQWCDANAVEPLDLNY